MLTEQFVAAISTSTKPNTGVTKDAGIFVHEYQPLAAQRHVFKKSAAAPNGIAVSSSHIFAAQAEKAIVHVYSREKGNQEAVVPFPERIHSIALAAHETVLLLGTESGRVLAWEIYSGRLVSTSNSHLQPVTSITVDSSTNFFLTGSSDAMIHYWALSSILSFSPETSRSPLQTLSTHRGPISSIVCGHSDSSSNIAVSISADKSAIVWNHQNGQLLRTYLLPEVPVAATLDPADRALYIGYGDGSLQTLDFYDEIQKHTTIDILRDQSQSHRPFQSSPKSRFHAESQKLGGVLSLSVSWDGTCLISGHASGKVALWDIAKSSYVSTVAILPGPVSNLQFLVPTGFPTTPEPTSRIQTVVKPKHDASSTGSGSSLVPTNYTLNMQFTSRLPSIRTSATTRNASTKTAFEEALTHPSIPQSMLDESLIELESWSKTSSNIPASAAEFMALDGVHEPGAASNEAQQREIEDLKKQLASLQRVQKVTFSQLSELRKEKEYYVSQEEIRSERARARATSKANFSNGANNTKDEDMEMSDGRSD